MLTVLVAVCWLATDVRPLAAITLQFLLLGAFDYADASGQFAANWALTTITVGLPLALTCALVWLLRHRARTTPPTIG